MIADKVIIAWLSDVSIANGGSNIPPSRFYRWLSAGVLPRRPRTKEDAAQLLRRIDEARDKALIRRPRGLRGRLPLAAIATTVQLGQVGGAA